MVAYTHERKNASTCVTCQLRKVQDLSHLRLSSPLTLKQSSVCAMWPPYQNATTGSQEPAQKNTALHVHAVATRQTGSSLKVDQDLYAINHAGPGSSVAVDQPPGTNDLHPNGNETDGNWKPSLRGQSDCGDAVCTISTRLPSRSKHDHREYVTGALAVALVDHSCRYIVCLQIPLIQDKDLSRARQDPDKIKS